MQQIVCSFVLALNNLARYCRIMLGSLIFITLVVAVLIFYIRHPSENLFTIKVSKIDKKEFRTLLQNTNELFKKLLPISGRDSLLRNKIDKNVMLKTNSHAYIFSIEKTLNTTLNQNDVNMIKNTNHPVNINQLVKIDKKFRNQQAGQKTSWILINDSFLQHFIWRTSHHETCIYNCVNDNSLRISSQTKNNKRNNDVLIGVLNGNFITSAQRAGLNNTEIKSIIKILQCQIDFRKLHAGDKFSVLLSHEKLNDKKKQSQLLGIHFRTGGKDYYAIRGENGKFYDRSGISLINGFMRFPTGKQYRVSSNFNPRRLNPVTGYVSPHKGVDFAMLIGTPVLAVGDGEVVQAKYSADAGNYVTIRHNRQYMTRYMHMKKLLVKIGDKTKRGDRIGLSGNAGRSTGPHLHYEIWVNNKAVNPLTAKLPHAEELIGKDRSAFLEKVKEILPQLKFD